MKFSIERDQLLEALQKVQSVVEKKNTVPILANILCIAEKDQLSLCATDLEVGIKISVPAITPEAGKVTLSAKHFLDIVKELPSKELQLKRKDNNWVEMTCEKSRFNIVSLAADEYPQLPDFASKTYQDARVETLTAMIDSTAFAVSTDATRYHLNGVFFEPLENNILRMTATDGHRLSFMDNEVFSQMPDMRRGVIIPKKGLNEFRKLLDQSKSSIGMAFERGYVFVKNENTYLFIRLIEGEYPDYRQVIPKESPISLKINRINLTAALKRVSLLAHEKSKGVKFSFAENNLIITSSNPDMGEAREELDVDYSGELLEIGFNARYMLDYLHVLSDDEVQFRLKDRLSPGLMQSADQMNHTYVIMPMRI